ncbi:CopG family ribbon-helix-helix protein [Mesorhizobium sp.]|uniref:CopG family ribbon-helix-helix protein n=1 Tax=Mesorhizobium sp. TaxID=1871066 RepID=UPI000FE37843|nr:CopG family ribbon-helix-helix protein [Mesorhizobium sp.]RWN58186.1 MAG: ribbon-helix-helix protein, CopG family [Mesorhizobium sp.]RWN79190.1 MAG: ribbon-helix-helix protein, CopG family [Mesorhizobium sp.]RWN84747.1 MAG: ribbon-helix-helix protein, CopG family [Mesorhizobium sp.]RWN92866.1 MAG: ribbon-helix-helix protein, CopG family [Mesorhizobium sp.]RWO17332.1 MAG: ribbon-helix-helix protein, CopG family [Mesorhizobium sp.]
MTAFTVRVPDETAKRLDQLAEKLDRSRSYVAAQAIEDFVAREEWQLAEIEAGLADVERGDFASDRDVAAVVGKYVKSRK